MSEETEEIPADWQGKADRVWAMHNVAAVSVSYLLNPQTAELVTACKWLLDITGNGYRGFAGDWATKLVELALKCDRINLVKLGAVWPEVAVATILYRDVSLEVVKTLAGIEDL